MIRVLIADYDLDSHELVDDLVEMIFRDVKIDRALSRESLFARLGTADADYHLIIFNYSMHESEITKVLDYVRSCNPDLMERIVFIITSENLRERIPAQYPVLVKPYSLDEFSEVVKKTCAV